MTLAEIEDLDERTALVWDGAPSSKPMTWAEAERMAVELSGISGELPRYDRTARLIARFQRQLRQSDER
jgi:hypothetical protein